MPPWVWSAVAASASMSPSAFAVGRRAAIAPDNASCAAIQPSLCGAPALAARRSAWRHGRIERGFAAVRLIDQPGQPRGERSADRAIVDRPNDRHPRIDRFRRARLQRRIGPADRCAGAETEKNRRPTNRASAKL